MRAHEAAKRGIPQGISLLARCVSNRSTAAVGHVACEYSACSENRSRAPMAEYRVSEEGVPIEHLDYTYVRNCTNVKEVEKILKVLR